MFLWNALYDFDLVSILKGIVPTDGYKGVGIHCRYSN